MGLSSSLRRFAAARPHLLVVEGPGGAGARIAAERIARERGWPLVATPADADILVATGSIVAIEEQLGRVWEQLPGPRARATVASADAVAAALDDAHAALVDLDAQRADVRRTERPAAAPPAEGGADPHAGHDMGGHDMGGHDMGGGGGDDPHAGHDMGGRDMGGHDMGGHDMGGGDDPHAGHDMGGMDMPAGLPMADRAPDRDGLKLDVLTLPWGPALPWWPGGLVVTTVLQGDIVQEAEVALLGKDADGQAGWAGVLEHLDPPVRAAAVRLDALTRLLAVAGWDGARLQCQQVRDALLAGTPTAEVAPRLHRLARRVTRSRSLARMTAGIATARDEDVTATYRRWLAEAVTAVDDGTVPPSEADPHLVHRLAALVNGHEVGTLRLVVASVDLALSGADAAVVARA